MVAWTNPLETSSLWKSFGWIPINSPHFLPPSAAGNLSRFLLLQRIIYRVSDSITSPPLHCLSLLFFTPPSSSLSPALPEEAREWIHLTLLSLRKNQLSELSPRVFEGWGKLQKLSLGFNRLVELPDSISFCVSLSELDLCDNLLTALPESLRLCRQLRRLNIGLLLSPPLLSDSLL
jgi:Leucine-rich repeat (LRR) protein